MTSSWSPDAYDEPWRGEPAGPPPERPHYRPPIGIPVPRERRIGSTLVAIALHLLVILLLLTPVYGPKVLQEVQGAGGPGPAGGGGGGTMGTGGSQRDHAVERLHYIQVAPPPTPVPTVKPPEPPKPTPVPPPVTPPLEQKPAPQPTAEASVAAAAPVPGTGGGTGSDGTAGSGPGSGGGVGSGVGTGRGAGVGPGTGGGSATIYPPQAIEIFLAPQPVPDKVRGAQVVAEFDVDSTGKVLAFQFTPTRDGGYNRKLQDVLKAVRFRPAVQGDGKPVRAKGTVTYTF